MLKKLFTKETSLDFVPLVFFTLILTLPFTLNTRLAPNTSYILDNITVSLCLLLVLTLGLQGQLWQKVPKTSWFFLLLALLWYIQTLFVPLHFVGQSYVTIGVFLSMALLAFATQALIKKFGQQKVITILAIALLCGALLQAAIGIIQLLDLTSFYNTRYENIAPSFNKLITRPSTRGLVYGQLAQRNHYAHYLMWGLISTCYLFSINKIRLFLSCILLSIFSILMAAAASRLVILYSFALVFFSFIWFYKQKDITTKKFFIIAIISTCLIIFFQTPIISKLIGLEVTGLSRASSSGFLNSRRMYEWYKTWLLFKQYPLLGVGWTQYSVHGFQLDSLQYFINEPKEVGLFAHSHNSFLQILAEMGLIITIIIIAGLFFIYKNFFKNITINNLFPLSLICVSLIHSFFEYPLWYVYFLAPFTIFMSLQTSDDDKTNAHNPLQNKIIGSFAISITIMLLVKIISLVPTYADLHNAYTLINAKESKVALREKLFKLSNEITLLRYETIYTLEATYNAQDDFLKFKDKYQYAINQQLVQYRPFSYPMMRRSIYLSLKGEEKLALENQRLTNNYYKPLIPDFLQLFNQTNFPALQQETRIACVELMKIQQKTTCQLEPPKQDTQKTEEDYFEGLLDNIDKLWGKDDN